MTPSPKASPRAAGARLGLVAALAAAAGWWAPATHAAGGPAAPPAASARAPGATAPARPPATEPPAPAVPPQEASLAERVDTLLVGVVWARDTATVYSGAATLVTNPATGDTLARAGPYEPWHFLAHGGEATAWGPWGELPQGGERLRVVPAEPDARVVIDGRPHRGQAEVVHRPGRGLVVANRVDLEGYLYSVVAREMGDDGLALPAAARAQAMVSRSLAVAFVVRGRRDSMGVDLLADPDHDQAYPGLLYEREASRRAVRATRGRIVVHDGEPALTFYHSTCGGRTVTPDEIWPVPDRPYLRSTADRPAEGEPDYCAASPWHRWRRSWSATELRGSVLPALADATSRPAGALEDVRSVEVTARSEHGRVTELTVAVETRGDGAAARAAAGPSGRDEGDATGASAPTSVDTLRLGTDEIPHVLVSPDGASLRSTRFEVVAPPEEGGLAVEGRGSGHGVGLCQRGTVERARRGAGWREILETYYPGTEVRRLEDVGRGG